MDYRRLDRHLLACKIKGVKVVLFSEYMLNSFFKELIKMPLGMIEEQSIQHLERLKQFAKEYQLILVAPLIIVKEKQPFKTIVKIAPNSTHYYEQQFLINYEHWNEEKFFANPIGEVLEPMTFNVERFKFALMGGFEIHFDILWQKIVQKGVDVVLVPTASTFESDERWREVLKTRAFTNQLYIVRANKIGEYKERNSETWQFYGDSLFILPNGLVEHSLGDKEELLIAELLGKDELRQFKREWKFQEALKKRGAL
jgi:predicted amidohydrolase